MRIETKVKPEENQYLRIKLEQDFDVLSVLSLSIYGVDSYPNPCSDWGVIMGRIVDKNNFPMVNVKVGLIEKIDGVDKNNVLISGLYKMMVNGDYPLLPNYKVNKNHTPIGSFPSSDEVLANTAVEYVFKKYYKYITSTNENGDYALMGVPLGSKNLLMNFDSADAGSYSTTPVQQMAAGQKDKKDFLIDQSVNSLPILANTGNAVTGTTSPTKVNGSISGNPNEHGDTTKITGGTITIGGGYDTTNKTGDIVTIYKKLNGGGTAISRNTNVVVKSFFGDDDQCELGINRYDFKLDYTYVPCNYIIGSFYSDFNIFTDTTPNYKLDNMSMATSKQNMGGKVSFLLDTSVKEEAEVIVDVSPSGDFYAAIPCKWDKYNIDEEGNWYKTIDGSGINTKTPYCLMMYFNNSVDIKLDGSSAQYSRASAIGFNLNNYLKPYKTTIGIDGSTTGVTTGNRFGINYNAQYYPASLFPKGYYDPLDSNYYTGRGGNSQYRNGAELLWDIKNKRSNVYTIASQWTKYGYYAAQSVENNGLVNNTYTDVLKQGRGAPLPGLYSTNTLQSSPELITELLATSLPLDDNVLPAWLVHPIPGDLNTGNYPNGTIGFTYNDFDFNNSNVSIAKWINRSARNNSVFEVQTGGFGNYKIKFDIKLVGDFASQTDMYGHIQVFDYYKYDIIINRSGNESIIYSDSVGNTTGLNGLWYIASARYFIGEMNVELQDGDKVYFRFYTTGISSQRHAFRLENTTIQFFKYSAGNHFPLIIGNMYLPMFEATKWGDNFYPVGQVANILDQDAYNAPKLTEMDLMLYPITDEIFNIVEHEQKPNEYENGTTNYYYFCNQFWKLRDAIYNELNG